MTFRYPRQNTSRLIKSHPAVPENADNQTPIFSLEYMVDGYCVESCQMDQRAHFAMALFKRSKLTWRELRSTHRHGLGCENISRDSLRVHLPSRVTEDINIIAFRCIGKAPMIGFRSGRVFNILWIDKNCDAYNHGS